MSEPILTEKQRLIFQRLQDGTYSKKDKPSQSIVTQIFKKKFMRENQDKFRNDLQYFFAYQKITSKKEKDLDAVKADLIKKIPGRIDKARLRTYLKEDKMEMLRDEVADLEAKSMEFAAINDKDDDDKPPAFPAVPAAPPAPLVASPPAGESGVPDIPEPPVAYPVEQGEGEGEGIGSMLEKYFDTGSKYYKDNKDTINKVLKAIQPSKIKDGSYLTDLASLAYPEIKVFQEGIKAVGLGFSKEDSEKFAQMLSRDPEERNKVSTEDGVGLMFKMFVNPDQIGVLVRTRAEQLGDDVKAWWKKLTNQPRDLSEKDEAVKEKIDERREETKKGREKDSTLDDWFGVKPDENKEKDRASKYDIMDSYSILIPPDDKLGEYTAGQDVLNVIRSIVSFGALNPPTKGQNKAQYLEGLKRDNPELFQQYTEAMDSYNQMRGKVGLEKDEPVNYETSKQYVDDAKNLTQDLIKKAIDSGKIDRKTADSLYDIWSGFDDIAGGDSPISYADMEKMQSTLLNALPRDIIVDNSDAINEFMANNKDSLTANFDGDSNLGDFGWLKDILDPPQDLNEDGTPKEKQIPRFKPTGAEPKYRYRGKWGNTDELFKKMTEDVEKRNLIIEVQRLRESVDTTNKLVQSQLMTDKMRFDNTFRMPDAPPSKYYPLPDKFKRDHRAIFTPAVIQNPMRDFERNTRDEAYFGQYQGFHPAVMPTSARQDLLTNPLVFATNADLATGGELQEVGKPTLFDLIKESRF